MAERTLNGLLRAGAGLMILGLVTACGNSTDPALVNSASYQQGWTDGCTTGNQRVEGFSDTVTRNQTLFETDEGYQQGWRAGYVNCGGQTRRDQRGQDFLFNDRFDQGPID